MLVALPAAVALMHCLYLLFFLCFRIKTYNLFITKDNITFMNTDAQEDLLEFECSNT